MSYIYINHDQLVVNTEEVNIMMASINMLVI